jgi:RNA polymerase sigma-70 factor, ECF subfamily
MKSLTNNDSQRDAALIAGFLAGDKHSFEILYDQYKHQLLAWFFLRCQDWEKAEDLTAEVFLRCLKELAANKYREEGHCYAWIFKHAKNVWHEEQRRMIRHPHAETPGEDEDDVMPGELVDEEPSEEEDIISEEEDRKRRRERSRVKAGLKQLSARQRQELQLRYNEGKSHKEIADIMGISEAGSRSLCRKAVNNLRKHMRRNRQS